MLGGLGCVRLRTSPGLTLVFFDLLEGGLPAEEAAEGRVSARLSGLWGNWAGNLEWRAKEGPVGSSAAAPLWDIMGGCELLFQRVQVSGAPMTWARLSEAAGVGLEARAPLGVGAESKLYNHRVWGCFWTAPTLLGQTDIPMRGVKILPPKRRLGSWASSFAAFGEGLGTGGVKGTSSYLSLGLRPSSEAWRLPSLRQARRVRNIHCRCPSGVQRRDKLPRLFMLV